eukprot:85830_1
MSAPVPLPCPPPIPNTISTASNIDALTQLPPLIEPKDQYYIRCQGKKFVLKYQLNTQLRNQYDLLPTTYDRLPNELCIFYWIQLVRNHDIHHALSKSLHRLPCIAFVPSQGMLCEKARFAKTMYDYYGERAWTYTPHTLYVSYNASTKQWNTSHDSHQDLKSVFNGVWITKTSTGSLGKSMYLFSGNSMQSLNAFLETNYTAKMERLIHKSKRYKNLRNYELYINPQASTLLNSVIIQKYLNKPLLFDRFYKFDIRIYALLATTNPSVLFYKFVKLRICASKYNDLLLENPMDSVNSDEDDEEKEMNITDRAELSKHISNSTMARGTKGFDKRSSTINGRATLSDYNGFVAFMYDMAVNKKQFDIEWFETEEYKTLYTKNRLSLHHMERIIDMKLSNALSVVYDAVKQSFDNDCKTFNRPCQFLLQGNDIMIDEKGTFWVLEVNQTPTMFKDNDVNIKNLMKGLLTEAIDIVMEIRDLKLNGFTVDQYTPLQSPLIWNKGHLNYKHMAIHNIDSAINNIDVLMRTKS